MFGAPAFAETERTAPGPQNSAVEKGVVERFDVARLKLGMSPSQVKSVLGSGGFTIEKGIWDDQDSWQAQLSKAVEARRPGTPISRTRVAARTTAVGRQGEKIEVLYFPTPGGAVVSQVTYTMPASRMTNEAFDAQVLSKYGKPGAVNPIWYYCDHQGTYCGGWGGTWDRFSDMSVFNNTIKLKYGGNFTSAMEKLFSEAVEAAAPRNGAATF
jgi:hypothetical protein